MSGGIHAIKGFDYQATVILDRLFDHFDQHGPTATVRPEGVDDLDLSWIDVGTEYRRHEQIKKPRENNDGELKSDPWTLPDVVRELLPNTIRQLSGNSAEQVWILGDAVAADVSALVRAGARAPTIAVQIFWSAVHGLARNVVLEGLNPEPAIRGQIQRWRIPTDLSGEPSEALSQLAGKFDEFASSAGAGPEFAERYRRSLVKLHRDLPSVLARTRLLGTYGSEQEVVSRVYRRLQQRYSLSRDVVENTLFRNLRGFINDISKQPGRRITLDEFEFELCGVWPRMLPIRDAPLIASDHIARRDLSQHFTTHWTGKAVEAVGISGSGKTTLAAEVVDRLRATEPTRESFYAEVRSETNCRDVLVGVAFHLRRIGAVELFAEAVSNGPGDEEALRRLAQAYSALSRDILILIDLVEGTCNDAFARDLALFIRALSSPVCRVAVLGQESALRELTALERHEQGIVQVDVRGFHFHEFVSLVAYYHPNPDRIILRPIYDRLTADRAAGLFAKLAHSLARAQSVEEMEEIASRPAEETLALAEQRRFARLSESVRSAATRIVSFALPFRRTDAEQVFPDENIGAAIRELLQQGLIRSADAESFEMHETVRAGLESTLAVSLRRSSHESLAKWYRARGLVSAAVLHLEMAGELAEARTLARTAFLGGQQWGALAPYVIRHQLVSAKETVRAFGGSHTTEDQYLLPEILRSLLKPGVIDDLCALLYSQPERYFDDYRWAMALAETILDLEPGRLYELIVFTVERASDSKRRESALDWLLISARRKHGELDSRTLDFFAAQPADIRGQLLGLLMLDPSRTTLQTVFQFLAAEPKWAGTSRSAPGWRSFGLSIADADEAIEFLASMPDASQAAMLAARGPLLGPLASLVWSRRKALREHCVAVIREGSQEAQVLVNGMRILVFLAEPSMGALCESLLARTDAVGAFAALVPALMPVVCDRTKFEARLLDRAIPKQDRLNALYVLASIGADLGTLRRRLQSVESDPATLKNWDLSFMAMCVRMPFPEAIPLLEGALQASDPEVMAILPPALLKVSGLASPAATDLLIRALTHDNPAVRAMSTLGLSQRRSRTALASLIDQYHRESFVPLLPILAVAIVASGPGSVEALRRPRDSIETLLWRCVLANRLRDASAADELVEIATDAARSWQLRRAAIWAAGRLPIKGALERIAATVMIERSPLSIDRSPDFLCHSALSTALSLAAPRLPQIFASGRAGFADFFASLLESSWGESMTQEGLPSGAEAAGWLFDRLQQHGWPAKPEALDLVLNELHVPMLHGSVLRSWRLSGQPDLIEKQLGTVDSVWLGMKCLKERFRAGSRDSELPTRLRGLVDSSHCKGNGLLHRLISEVSGSSASATPGTPMAVAAGEEPEPEFSLSYDDAIRVLLGSRADVKPIAPVRLETVTAEQCERLIRLANPLNDRDPGVETFLPAVRFTSNGHLVAQRRVTYSGESPVALLRPGIAAANIFGIPNAWHQELVTGPLSGSYVSKYLACLGARNDSDQFYSELAAYEDVLIGYLCNFRQVAPVLKYVDARIVPTLSRYVSSGDDEMFEGLCTLALRVKQPEIDEVLAALLHRWSRHFQLTSVGFQEDGNTALWRAFNRLIEHPRFDLIEGWQPRLTEVLSVPMAWYRAENIVQALERSPRSYALIEMRLFKAVNWMHRHRDEIDQLDDAAERWFPEVREF
jgi:hypothetical protein